jgi:hypothetical protein
MRVSYIKRNLAKYEVKVGVKQVMSKSCAEKLLLIYNTKLFP